MGTVVRSEEFRLSFLSQKLSLVNVNSTGNTPTYKKEIMSETEGASSPIDPEDLDEIPGYKPPEKKTMEEMKNLDKDDEALERYKASLLGDQEAGVVVFPDDERQVIVQKLALVVDGRPDMEIDLTQDLKEIAKKKFVLKEGVRFKIRIEFIVQREIVTGLKYVQTTSRLGVPVDKMKYMVGSYAPKSETQSYTTPYDDAPSGMVGRGSYHVTSFFTDDDQHNHLKWEWTIEVDKDWAEQ